MIRRVAFKKAILAGTLGALAWEVVMRVLILLGLPFFDLIFVLGTMIFGIEARFFEWWVTGIVMHMLVGAIWAIFYAYFFWSAFDHPPILQGLLFSLIPAVLAGWIMIPQMDYMQLLIVNGVWQRNSFFAIGIGWGGPVTVALGHLIYGAVLGSIYTKPVGYPIGKRTLNYE